MTCPCAPQEHAGYIRMLLRLRGLEEETDSFAVTLSEIRALPGTQPEDKIYREP